MFENIVVIPARSGSKRIENKNLKDLYGFPLIYYSIYLALNCGLFSKVYVSTDSKEIADVSIKYGAEVPFLRPTSLAEDDSPDIDWVQHFLNRIEVPLGKDTFFTILRPTNPCRSIERIVQAHNMYYRKCYTYDSLRAMRPVSEHPGKMWHIDEIGEAIPLLNGEIKGIPWHSSPTQSLPKIFIQNANLEITTVGSIERNNSIAGNRVLAWINNELDGIDLNDEKDWQAMIKDLRDRKLFLSDKGR